VERFDMANAKLTLMIGKQDVLIEQVEENTSVLDNFKSETNNNFDKLTNIMIKHDVNVQERIAILTTEISQIKERLSRLELAIA
jgi:hypothetical protein